MRLELDTSGWKRVRLGDVIRRSRKQVDLAEAGIERYVAGGHIDAESMIVERWGDPDDGQMGSTFRYAFEPGQILFVSARPYLRKTGVVGFSGVVADKTYVLDAIPERGLLQDFLPFVLASDPFVEYASSAATGSMNPRLLWGPFQRYEFNLPPQEEQARLARLLWAVSAQRKSCEELTRAIRGSLVTMRARFFGGLDQRVPASSAFSIRMGRQRAPQYETGDHVVAYLRSANVTPAGIDLSDVKRMNFDPSEQEKFALLPGDVLVSEASASPTAVGMPAVWLGGVDEVVCFQNTLLRFRARPDISVAGFAEQWCRWAFESGEFLAAAAGTSIRHIGVRGASAIPVRLPGIGHQAAFVERISQVAVADQLNRVERDRLATLQHCMSAQIFGGAE